MRTSTRRQWLIARISTDFRKNQDVKDPQILQTLIIAGETHLDSIKIQSQHLTRYLILALF